MTPPSVSLTTEPDPAARGRVRAEAFDTELRQRELRARHQRLADLQRAVEAVEGPDVLDPEHEYDVEEELLELRATLASVHRSRVWRLAQTLRGFVGRRW